MKRKFRGRVASISGEKSIIVSVDSKKEHPIYRKKFRHTSKFMAHNEIGAKVGDYVIIEETKPISKSKKWNAIKIITEKELEVTE